MPEPQSVGRVTGSDSPRFFIYRLKKSITVNKAETWESIGAKVFFMRIKHYFFSVLSLLWAFAVPMDGFRQSKLQQYLDSLANQSFKRRATPAIPAVIYRVVDLSEFDSDITEPLYVRNKINVKFVNGKLIRKFEGNLIVVQDGSSLVIGEGVQLLSQSIQSNYLVLVNGGKLIVQAGVIDPRSLDGSTVTAGGYIY